MMIESSRRAQEGMSDSDKACFHSGRIATLQGVLLGIGWAMIIYGVYLIYSFIFSGMLFSLMFGAGGSGGTAEAVQTLYTFVILMYGGAFLTEIVGRSLMVLI